MCAETSLFANVWSQIKTNIGNFHPPKFVGHGIETQLQVSENLNCLI